LSGGGSGGEAENKKRLWREMGIYETADMRMNRRRTRKWKMSEGS